VTPHMLTLTRPLVLICIIEHSRYLLILGLFDVKLIRKRPDDFDMTDTGSIKGAIT